MNDLNQSDLPVTSLFPPPPLCPPSLTVNVRKSDVREPHFSLLPRTSINEINVSDVDTMNPFQFNTANVGGRTIFRKSNGRFRAHAHTPPYSTPEERARIAARRGKPLAGTIVSRPALRLPAPTAASRVEYEIKNGTLIMRVKQPNDKAGIMTLDIQGRYEDETYEMCLMFRGAAAHYMGRCRDGDSPDSYVLGDLIASERRVSDFPIGPGDYVLVAEKADTTTNRPKLIKVAYKPSFLDRLPTLEDEWDEAVALDGEGGDQAQGDGQDNTDDTDGDGGRGEDEANDPRPGAPIVEG